MGLDVYLKKCPNFKRASKMEAAYNAELNAIYDTQIAIEKERDLTQEECDNFNAIRAGLREKYEIENYEHNSVTSICRDSKTQPDHLFKIGYLRSSYNDGGMNSVAAVFSLPNLYQIFEVTDEEYYQFPDWDTIYLNLKDAIEKWQAHADSPAGKYDVMSFRPNFADEGVTSREGAFERFNQEYLKEKEKIDADEWQNTGWISQYGHFYPTPLKVVAIIGGAWNSKQRISYFNEPHTYLVYERDKSDTIQWYVTALLIAQEMIEWILEQPDKDHYYLGWSG
ncbi:MAG: hypothetical protein P4L77_10630 [Sulfuriferula sp.]|nr:hypothetical protein [Sulfuriferula sp.]